MPAPIIKALLGSNPRLPVTERGKAVFSSPLLPE